MADIFSERYKQLGFNQLIWKKFISFCQEQPNMIEPKYFKWRVVGNNTKYVLSTSVDPIKLENNTKYVFITDEYSYVGVQYPTDELKGIYNFFKDFDGMVYWNSEIVFGRKQTGYFTEPSLSGHLELWFPDKTDEAMFYLYVTQYLNIDFIHLAE